MWYLSVLGWAGFKPFKCLDLAFLQLISCMMCIKISRIIVTYTHNNQSPYSCLHFYCCTNSAAWSFFSCWSDAVKKCLSWLDLSSFERIELPLLLHIIPHPLDRRSPNHSSPCDQPFDPSFIIFFPIFLLIINTQIIGFAAL